MSRTRFVAAFTVVLAVTLALVLAGLLGGPARSQPPSSSGPTATGVFARPDYRHSATLLAVAVLAHLRRAAMPVVVDPSDLPVTVEYADPGFVATFRSGVTTGAVAGTVADDGRTFTVLALNIGGQTLALPDSLLGPLS